MDGDLPANTQLAKAKVIASSRRSFQKLRAVKDRVLASLSRA